MTSILNLWLPILLSAVFVFIASSLIHMVFKWHNSEYLKLSNEDEVRAAIRKESPGPGQYVLPWCPGMKEMESEAMKQKFAQKSKALGNVTSKKLSATGIKNYHKQKYFLSLQELF